MVSPTPPSHLDAIDRMVQTGITIQDLSAMTGLPMGDVESQLIAVKPMRGIQTRARVYDLYTAMEALRGAGDAADIALEETIKRMKPNQLPPSLSTEFWKGQKARLEYMEEVEQLWRQERVQLAIATVLKVIRQQMTLLADNVDQQATLTIRQREIIQGIADATLGECRDAVIESFNGWDGTIDKEDRNPARKDT